MVLLDWSYLPPTINQPLKTKNQYNKKCLVSIYIFDFKQKERENQKRQGGGKKKREREESQKELTMAEVAFLLQNPPALLQPGYQ